MNGHIASQGVESQRLHSEQVNPAGQTSERDSEMNTLRIYAFGGFRVYWGDEPIDDFPTRKVQSLFCYLILNRHRFHPREVLAELFWSKAGRRNAKACLNTALWRLRRILESHEVEPTTYLIVDREQIRFNTETDYWFDVEEFEALSSEFEAEREDTAPEAWNVEPLRRSVKLYQGHLLDGFYDDWFLYDRERLQQMFLRALARLMVYHGAKGQYEKGIAYGQQILSLDPLREEVHRRLMRYYQLAGRRACALRQYQVCRRVLREELDIEPMPETVALYGRMREQPADEKETWAEYEGALASQTKRALAQLQGALEQFDEAKRQLRRAMIVLEELSINLIQEI